MDIYNVYIILTILDKLFLLMKPTLSFKSKNVVILFKKSNVNNAICYSTINEFQRTENLFAHISDYELEFIEIDCESEPTKCLRFNVYGVPQIHAYFTKNNFKQEISNQTAKINSTENNIFKSSSSDKYMNNNAETSSKSTKTTKLHSKYSLLLYILNFLDKISPISFRCYFTNIFKREKIRILDNTAESISYFISNFSNGKYQPNLKKYTLTAHRSPLDVQKLVFQRYKCSISTFYQYMIPTNVREFYDDILLNQTFQSNFTLKDQLETSFIDGLRYQKEIKNRYNITHFPMMAFEYMGLKRIVNTSISIETMKKFLTKTCKSSFIPSSFPKKQNKR